MTLDLTASDLESAFERVAENEGCAGVDDVSVHDFRKRAERETRDLLSTLREDRYRPLPLRLILVEKAPGSGKTRRLLVPAVRDRVLQTAVARRLSRSFEEEFLESSYAYRPGLGVDRAVARVLQLRERGFEHLVDADVRQFFDRVEHSLLLDRLAAEEPSREILDLLRLWVRAEFWDGRRVRRLRRGIAQGSPLSPLLANFFLSSFDLEVSKGGNHLVRYADDFLILCPTADAAQAALEDTARLLATLGLELHREKSRVTCFQEGFTFLGVYFYGNRAWVPWKNKSREQGKLLFCADPMPEHVLARYQLPAPMTTMELAWSKHEARAVSEEPPAAAPVPGGALVAYLYVTEQGAVVRKSADRYLVEAGGRILLDLPYHKLESILLFGRVQITTQALHAMLERGIQVGLFSRQGRYRGALAPVRGKQVDLRLKQFELYQDSTRSLGYARAVLRAKIANGLEVLRRYAERAGQSADSENRRAALEHALEALPATQALESMLGFEGTAARIYFEGLGDYNRSGFAWDGREKRPSPDPLNAALSLTYALLTHEMAGALEGLGLDPHVGFLHRIDYGRPSLALDLVEPLRHPAADRLVWTVMNRRTFAKEDFVSSPDRGGVVFTQAALKAFLAEYERWMLAESAPARSFRRAIRAQAEAFVGALRNGGGFDPFDWKQHLEGPPPCSTSSATT